MGGKLVVEHGQLHHRLVVNKGQLQLAQLDAQRFDGAEARDDKWEDNQTVGHEKRLALQLLGLAIEEERTGNVRELELYERGQLNEARCLILVGREANVEHEERQPCGGSKPELQNRVGADEQDH